MESDEPTPRQQLSELDGAIAATRRASFPPTPHWYFLAIGVLGPVLVVFTTNRGLLRVLAVVAIVVILLGLLANDRGRRSLRPRRAARTGRQQWLFTAMIFSVIVIAQLIQRAGEQANPVLMGAASFVALAATSWWFSRRIEADVDRDPLGRGTS